MIRLVKGMKKTANQSKEEYKKKIANGPTYNFDDGTEDDYNDDNSEVNAILILKVKKEFAEKNKI